MKVLVVSGASGGHIFPALAFIDEFKKSVKEGDVLLVLPERSIKSNVDFSCYNVNYIDIVALGTKLNSKNILAFLKFIKASFKCLLLVLRFKPDVVVGFGSLVSFPIIFWAWMFRIKTIIHEQNVVLGKANKFMAKFVDKIAISFQDTKKYLGSCKEKIVFTGNLLRSNLNVVDKNKALEFFGLDKSKFTVLIMGGSQGSHNLNKIFTQTVLSLDKNLPIQFVHLCGAADYDWLSSEYKKTNFSFKLFGFLKEMNYAYSCADLAVSRSGATTVTELIKFQVPVILVPYPFAQAHQLANAKVLENLKSAIIIEEKDLFSFAGKFTCLIVNPKEIEQMRSNYKNFQIGDSEKKLLEAVVNKN